MLVDAMELHLILCANGSLHDIAFVALLPLSLDAVTRRNEHTYGVQPLHFHHIHDAIVSVPHSLKRRILDGLTGMGCVHDPD